MFEVAHYQIPDWNFEIHEKSMENFSAIAN